MSTLPITTIKALLARGIKDAALTEGGNLVLTLSDGAEIDVGRVLGYSIEYDWNGTQLGIRQEGEAEYEYVDLAADLSVKADKVTGAAEGNFVSLTSEGNISDSGKAAADFADADEFAGHTGDTDIHITAAEREGWDAKADKDTDASAGNVPIFAADKNLVDSGKKIGALAQKVTGGTEGNLASLTSGGDIADSGYAASDFLGKSEVLRWSDSQTSYAEQNKEVLARLNALPDEKVNVVLVANGSRLSLSRRTSNGAYYFSGQTQSEDQLPCEYMLRRAGALYREVKYDLIANEEILEDDFLPPTCGLVYTALAEKAAAEDFTEHAGDTDIHITAAEHAALSNLIYNHAVISAFTVTPSVAELGASITPALSATLTGDAATLTITSGGSAVYTQEHAGGTETYTAEDATPCTSARQYTATVTDDYDYTATRQASISFYNGVYYGVGADGTGISSLTRSLQSGKAKTFTVNAGTGEYIYYALPSRYGTPTFKVGGFEGGFELLSTESYTNSSGYAEEYKIWKSTNTGLGSQTVTVS